MAVLIPKSTDQQLSPLLYGPSSTPSGSILGRTLHSPTPLITAADAHTLTLSTTHTLLDSTSGAAVSCLGHSHPVVTSALISTLSTPAPVYVNSILFNTPIAEEAGSVILSEANAAATACGGAEDSFGRVYFCGSGSEACEAALKLGRQYFVEKEGAGTKRRRWISRWGSYHGTTLGALSVSGHYARRKVFEDILLPQGEGGNVSFVSACNAYRGKKEGETDWDYGQRLVRELDEEFQRVGPDSVIAFLAEPVVGAALGCVTAVEGYWKGCKEVCERYGALMVADEVMCGIGRTGGMFAFQAEGVVPDLVTVGKGLGGGYVPVAGVVVGQKVVGVLDKGTGAFAHGHTYQAHPLACTAIVAVQKVIRQENLLANVVTRGKQLEALLEEQLAGHKHVGNIRGRGLFWGIEFVKDKETKEPFPVSDGVSSKVCERALELGICLYPCAGSAGEGKGDHVLICPPYTITEGEIEKIVEVARRAVVDVLGE
ncbi:PLP-dependent transferase [Ascobolus immersus RN42]|uniref:PLP-dependent transferase n=1 Tax=Ascobolus immersus RN42 TaxID=1160509 RepID=A0A3N4I3J3_ASCIM|nr:PLP-dependent transferase [Ascobolus immersus RN42]